MIALLLQASLLMLVAYFLGAWFACVIRRSFFAGSIAARPRETIAPAPQPVEPRIVAAGGPAPAPIRRPDPEPIAPRIETIRRPDPAPVAPDAAARFGRALEGGAPAPAPIVARAPAPVPPPAPPKPVAPVPPALVAARPAPAPAPAPTPVAAAQPPPPAAASNAATASAIAAAAAAAAAAAQRMKGPAPAESAPAAKPPQQVVLPAASTSTGQASVSAPILLPAAEPASAEDLTLIRGIDADVQARLNGLGIRRFADIADWKPQDVARISDRLGFKGRIEQENWIEQAQILAKGGETLYARRKLRGELATSTPSDDEGVERPIVAAAPAPVAPRPAPAVASSPAQTAAAIAGGAVVRPLAPAPAGPVPPPVPSASVAAASPPKVEEPAAFSATTPAPPTAETRPAGNAVAGAAASAAAAAAATTRATGLVGRDNLQRIGGINAEVEQLLNVQGVSRYSQIAGWTASDIARFDRLLGYEGRIGRENWIEQAQILARGGETAHSREHDRRAAEANGETRRPTRLADAIRDTEAAAASKTGEPGPAAAAKPRSDLAALRSVRSEAYRAAESVSVPAAAGTIATTGQAAGSTRVRAGAQDDLKRIRGIGVLIEKKLNAMGVTSYEQVANWTSSDIDRVSQQLDFKGRIERENWVEQARILASGGQTEFSRRVDRGEFESSRSKPQ
jgi:predicted flap endonuclease-1-like 5' DNA nuclease